MLGDPGLDLNMDSGSVSGSDSEIGPNPSSCPDSGREGPNLDLKPNSRPCWVFLQIWIPCGRVLPTMLLKIWTRGCFQVP